MVEAARSLIGSGPPLAVDGVEFRYDCSGFVTAAYYAAGIDLTDAVLEKIDRPMSGSELIYEYLKGHGRVFTRHPTPGDIVFFDNSYDRNHNGRLDDEFTHVAIVERVLPGGTLELIHLGNAGIGRIHMNLKRPHEYRDEATGELLNHKLRNRQRADPDQTVYLAGELFRAFGRIH